MVWVGMMVAVRRRRVVIGVVIFSTAEPTWGRQRVVMWVVVWMRGEVW